MAVLNREHLSDTADWWLAIPEVRLVIAIIRQAAADALAGDKGALAFIHSGAFDFWCECIGVQPEAIRRRMPRRVETLK